VFIDCLIVYCYCCSVCSLTRIVNRVQNIKTYFVKKKERLIHIQELQDAEKCALMLSSQCCKIAKMIWSLNRSLMSNNDMADMLVEHARLCLRQVRTVWVLCLCQVSTTLSTALSPSREDGLSTVSLSCEYNSVSVRFGQFEYSVSARCLQLCLQVYLCQVSTVSSSGEYNSVYRCVSARLVQCLRQVSKAAVWEKAFYFCEVTVFWENLISFTIETLTKPKV